MQKVLLGTRDLWVSRLLFGTLTMGPLQCNLPVERGAELLCYASKRGVNFVDTAEYYQTYPYIKAALTETPDLVVCTKSYAFDRDSAKRSVELAQEGIGRERIDVFLMHEQESVHTLRGHEGALSYYMQLRDAGVIGAVGISTHYVAATRAAATWPGIDVIFPLINRTGLGIVDASRLQMERAIALAAGNNRAILAMKVLGGGHLIGNREEAFQYALSLPGITAIAVGMQSEAEIDYNIAVLSGAKPDDNTAKASAGTQRRLIVQDWCEGCGNCVRRCGQGALSLRDGKAIASPERCVLCGYCAAVCPQFCLKVI